MATVICSEHGFTPVVKIEVKRRHVTIQMSWLECRAQIATGTKVGLAGTIRLASKAECKIQSEKRRMGERGKKIASEAFGSFYPLTCNLKKC